MNKFKKFNLHQFGAVLTKEKHNTEVSLDPYVLKQVFNIANQQGVDELVIKQQLVSELDSFLEIIDNEIFDPDEQNHKYYEDDEQKVNYVKNNLSSVQETCCVVDKCIRIASDELEYDSTLTDFETSTPKEKEREQ